MSIDAPWSKDLETQFADPEIRAQVDAFLRGTVQPHVTRVEQQSRDAMELYNDLQNEDTAAQVYVAITQQLFGDDLADRVIEALQNDPESSVEAESTDAKDEESTEDEELRELLEERRADKQAKLYADALSKLKEDKGLSEDSEFHESLFHPFVAGAGGDLDAAYDAYQEYVAQFKAAFGAAPTPEDGAPTPPPVLGDATPPAPPTEKVYGSIADAVEDVFAEMRATAPPTVGSV